MTGIALPLYELPTALLDLPTVRDRVHERHGQPEVQFHWWHEPTFLPVRLAGSPHAAGLTALDLRDNRIGPEAAALRAQFGKRVKL